jgi:4-diphosphocytidyl-2-C-methyl-D-erythritol kinase
MTVERLSPCKVNLLLNILGKRPDGFHELETLFHHVRVHDRLTFQRSSKPVIELTCNHPELPTDSANLVYRAAVAFFQDARIENAGARIHLEKNVPLAAGLGGGSGNAAQTLIGLNELFGKPLLPEQLVGLAAALGSDVPFFLQDRPALGVGRGERVQSLEPFESLSGVHILLIHPGFGISTAWAYKNLARFPEALNGRPGRAAELVHALRAGNLEEAAAGFHNSLEAPCLEKFPLLAMFQEFLREHGASAALMSGSGSTTFALVRGEPNAIALRDNFLEKFGSTAWTAIAPMYP